MPIKEDKWRHRVQSIYCDEFKRESYLDYRRSRVEEKVRDLGWDVTAESILKRLKSCHNMGFVGFHFIDGHHPAEAVDSYVRNLFDKTDYIASCYCKTHDKISLLVRLEALQIQPYQYSFSERGAQMVDFCYDFDTHPDCADTESELVRYSSTSLP